MPARFTATKDAVELKSIQILQDREKAFVIKSENDFKGITFHLVWDRIEHDTFKLTCFHRGSFTIMTPEFKELVEFEPYNVINTIMLKELFTITYKSNPLDKPKDRVYTDEINFKFLELFEDDDVMYFYISRLVDLFGWKLETQDSEFENWEEYIV
jgi:hypothetical protein